MSEPRIKAGLWVSAALRLGGAEGKPGMVIRKGDADAGGVVVVLRGRTGNMVLTRLDARHRRRTGERRGNKCLHKKTGHLRH
jgi:hypothetical protein